MTYKVVSRYYDNGKVEAHILTESEAFYNGTRDADFVETDKYDQYADSFPTMEKAEEFIKTIKCCVYKTKQ
jgi:hypothetical protein